MSWSNENGAPGAGPTSGNDYFAGAGGPGSADGGAGDDDLMAMPAMTRLKGARGTTGSMAVPAMMS